MAKRHDAEGDEIASALHGVERLIGGKLVVGSIRTPATEAARRNPAAAAFGKLGAAKGGKARAAALSRRRRKDIAKKAARARWGKTS